MEKKILNLRKDASIIGYAGSINQIYLIKKMILFFLFLQKRDKNLIFIGQGSHFELWNCDNYYENLSQININEGNEFPEELKGFSL